MTTTIPIPDDTLPLEVGAWYMIGSSSGGNQWVEIYAMDYKNVYARGVEGNFADLTIPRWKFDDVVNRERYIPAPIIGT